ncbi:hypothetical protein ACFVX6_32805 [Streptomyces sp. NPDC058289]|uniref:YxiG-like protein n=1 Tax=Streptomyces sp. NPDC058289 TaxID=3346425 RepID=UPI0036EC89B6
MDVAVLQQMLDEVEDNAVVHHGYTSYMRDYEIIVYVGVDPQSNEPAHLRYLFRYCVDARCVTSVVAPTWRMSLDDRLIDYETGVDLDGFVWGVKWANLTCSQVLLESEAAGQWSRAVGIDFHEVLVDTNAHSLTLIFSDLRISEVPIGYAPFVTD